MLFHPEYHYYSAGDWLWSIFSTVLFVGLCVAAIVLLVRVFAGPRPGRFGATGGPVPGRWYGPGPGPGRPMWRTTAAVGGEQILAERFARGEISEEEYRARLDVLRSSAPDWAARPPHAWPPQAEAQQQPPPEPPAEE